MLKDTLKRNETAAANADALAVLREKFAGCFTKDGAFDLKVFAERIRDKVAVTEEGYQLDFLGKNYARLTREAEKVDLAGYEAYLCGHHLYLVNANFGAKNVKALLEKYETDKAFTPDKIVLFGYSFGWKELEELDTNLKKLKTTRNITADLDIRY